jgi:glycosyltransferase involved in cell wall biosynthesis
MTSELSSELEQNETPLVSVIIPTHKRPRLLAEALKSLMEQSYPHWEAIIIDNGSQKTVEAVVDTFNEPRMHYFYQEEGNRSKARNFGVSQAAGEYIAFLDDDDRFMPDKLLEQVKYMNAHREVGLVSCGVIMINKEGEKIVNWPLWEDHEALTLDKVLPGCGMMPSSVMMRKIWYEHIGGFDPNLHLAEDFDFFIHLLYEGCRMEFVKYFLLEYRVHPGDSKKHPLEYGHNYEHILGRIFKKPYLSDHIKHQQYWIRARFALLTLANTFLDAGDNEDLYKYGVDFYHIAEKHLPSLEQNKTPVIEAIVGASRRYEFPDPFEKGQRALLEAGRRVPISRNQVLKARARLAQESFVRAYKRGDYQEARRYFWKSAWLRPTWLRHKVVWGILKNTLFKIRPA